jgi:hypothetical protein
MINPLSSIQQELSHLDDFLSMDVRLLRERVGPGGYLPPLPRGLRPSPPAVTDSIPHCRLRPLIGNMSQLGGAGKGQRKNMWRLKCNSTRNKR